MKFVNLGVEWKMRRVSLDFLLSGILCFSFSNPPRFYRKYNALYLLNSIYYRKDAFISRGV